MRRFHLWFLSVLLCLAAASLFIYKVHYLNYPLSPDEQANVWTVDAHVSFVARNMPVQVYLNIPKSNGNFIIMDENFISRGYGLATKEKDGNRRAMWVIRKAVGQQGLYYRAVVRQGGFEHGKETVLVQKDEEESLAGVKLEAIKSLVAEVKQKSADTETFVVTLLGVLNQSSLDSNLRLLLGKKPDLLKKAQVAVTVLNEYGIKARVVHGVDLNEPARNAPWIHRLEVYENKAWRSYDVKTGDTPASASFLPWWRGDFDLVTVKGADRVRSVVSVEKNQESAIVAATSGAVKMSPALIDFSLFSLPVETQRVYKIILLIPLGALLVAFLRNLIGISTFGTFMPVLIALAFRETELLWGIIFFTSLMGLGVTARFYLENLKLLLVPRLTAVLTIVVLLMAVLSILTHKLGLERGLSLALFPMVIITMSIERMCLLWDERGALAAMKQTIGTLAVASVVYLVLNIKTIEHLFFLFPELLLIVLALAVLLGRYRGYRLFELYRFRELGRR